jgi:hypothetical protein
MSKNNSEDLVKKPYMKIPYTLEEVMELEKCADPDTGPMHFMEEYFYIQHPLRGRIKFVPFDYQIELVANYHNNRFSINMLGRQMGKTTCAAGYLLWFAMFIPDSTILIAAHKYTGAQEIMQRIRYAYEAVPDFIRCGVTSYNKGSIEFDNGSRIVSATTTETTGRGMSISLLYCDEFAFVRPTIAREFWTSISPTLSTGGKAIVTSTPNSDEDQFAEIWKIANHKFDEYGNETRVGKNGFAPIMFPWDRHPERTQAWADQERASIGDDRFKREHECKFIIFDETLIAPSKLATMEGINPLEKQGQVRWYNKPKKNVIHAVALDPSLGTGGDPAAIQVWDITNMVQVAEWQHNLTTIQKQVAIMSEICKYIIEETDDPTNLYYTVENNTIGEAALNAIYDIGEERIQGQFLSEPMSASVSSGSRRYRKGFNTSHRSKISACAKLKLWVETDRMAVNSKSLISEFKNFVASGNTYKAKIGETDDLVMSTLLIIRMALLLRQYDQDISDNLKDDIEDMIEPMPFILV